MAALSKNSPNAWDAPGAGGNGIEQWGTNTDGMRQARTGVLAGGGIGGGAPAPLVKRKVGLDSFKIVRVIGKGSFGKVGTWLLSPLIRF